MILFQVNALPYKYTPDLTSEVAIVLQSVDSSFQRQMEVHYTGKEVHITLWKECIQRVINSHYNGSILHCLK